MTGFPARCIPATIRTACRAAMDEGADPTPYLTLVQMCAFPAGTDEVVLEMSVACGGLIE